MGARALPLDCRKKLEIKGFCVCFGEDLERKRKKETAQKMLQNA